MIYGIITEGKATISVIFRLPSQPDFSVDFVKGRFEELKREIIVGVEQLERGEVIDGDVVFRQLEEKLQQRLQQID